ncbi:MAG: carbamoyltransferase HypF [Candidatus Promineifilaceae bacterium]
MTIQQTTSTTVVRRLLHINGIVQGVGFRPFIHRLAEELNLSGWVRNTESGVEMALQGEESQLDQFTTRLRMDAPPLAHILSVEMWPVTVVSDEAPGLTIRASETAKGTAEQPSHTLVAPDVATCDDCLQELLNPTDRRYQYPFTNCTQCGPRYTIVESLPFDRPTTTMQAFPLCPTCEQEYTDNGDRRFHAQAVACPECGPSVWFMPSENGTTVPTMEISGREAIGLAVKVLNNGQIIAIKGLGGFHLACRADMKTAVYRLRESKKRPHKPLALMVSDLAMVQEFCHVGSAEEWLLTSPEAPIVLLHLKEVPYTEKISPLISPQNNAVGVMLAYTPLHHLLLRAVNTPLVMTSANWPGEPLCTDNEEAWWQLRPMCDAFLFHNRPIAHRCDDSVVFVANLTESPSVQPVRRSRGYVPVPVMLPSSIALKEPLAAAGADLKNVSAVANEQQVFLTQHIGDLEKFKVRSEHTKAIATFEDLFHIHPQTIVCDLHPNYVSSRYAKERAFKEGLRLVEVQHHHAHIAGCLAENEHTGSAIGLAFDGTGYGSDGQIWGGEFLLADLANYQRPYHLEYLPLPGGDAAIRRPYRIAIAYLLTLCPHINVSALFPYVPDNEIGVIETMLEQELNTPLTSSMGRLFDAVSAMLGLCDMTTHEAQAAMALETAAWQSEVGGRYYFCLQDGQIRLDRLLGQIAADRLRGAPTNNIARRFHNTIAMMAVSVAETISQEVGKSLPVALSGGVWQNRLLLEITVPMLRQAGFEVLLHRQVPANDGGLAYGQTAVAAARLKELICV